MPIISADWGRISRLLDQALDLEPALRAQWVDSLAAEHADLRETLRELLSCGDVVKERDFLQCSPNIAQFLPESSTAAGDEVGRYRLIRELGRGGMATVWLAELTDGTLQRKVALKFPHTAWLDRGLVARMVRERDILASLEHPNIARLYDAGVDVRGRPYLALEYVDGAPLDSYVRERELTLRQRLELFLKIARAVAFAHARLIVHRDLKPTNILVTSAGDVRLLDFGIARLLEPDLTQTAHPALAAPHTQSSMRALTPAYAAPEQFTGQPITVATDIYSLGVLLYELLTGLSPYAAKMSSDKTLAEAVMLVEPPAPSSVVNGDRRRALRGDFDAILRKALQKSSNDRYATVNALVEDLERYLAGRPVSARRGSRWYIAWKFARRNAFALGASAVVAVAIVVALGIAVWQWREAGAQRAAAVDRLSQAEAALNFTTAVLTEGVAQGELVSLEDLQSRSEEIATRLSRNDPALSVVAAEMLSTWYSHYGAYEKAANILTRSIDSFPKGQISAAKTRGICERASIWRQMGRIAEANADMQAEMERSKKDPATAAYCLVRQAQFARQLNNGEAALAFALEAQRRYGEAGGQSADSKSQLLGEIGIAHSLLGNADLAQRFFAQAMQQLESVGLDEGIAAMALRSNWGAARLATGNPLQALELFEQSIATAQGRSATEDLPAYLLGSKATALQLLARNDDALAAYDMVVRIAKRDNDGAWLVFALSGKAEVARQLGRLDDSQAFLDEAAAALKENEVSADDSSALRRRIVQSFVWAARGRLADANASFTELLDDFARLKCCGASRARVLVGRAEVNLVNHQLDKALADAEQALELAKAAQGRTPYSYATGNAWLILGRIRQEQNRPHEAGTAFASAVQHLSNTLGKRHPTTQRAITESMRSRMRSPTRDQV